MSADSAVSAPNFPPVRRREIFGWCCFDFANSAYVTIIVTVVYFPYFTKVVAGGHAAAAAWWGLTLAAAQLAVLLVSPLIGAISDIRANKKAWLAGTATTCAVSTLALAAVGPGEIWLALGLVGLATAAFYLSENICAGFLPEISTPANAGRISGYGWSFGYFGGLLCLVLALYMIEGRGWPVPRVFTMTGVFFALAALPTLLLLRERAVPRPPPPGRSVLAEGWGENLRSLRGLAAPGQRVLAMFFVSLFFATAGLTAIVAFASGFAETVIGYSTPEVLKLFVVLQLAGVAGASGFGYLQDRTSPKLALCLALGLWIVVCVAAWACPAGAKGAFYAVGIGAGVAMGAFQAGGRAVVALFTPEGKSGEYFGFWGFFSKLAGVVGQPVFGLLVAWLGYRTAILANAGFFLAGLLVLLPLALRPAKASKTTSCGCSGRIEVN
ncbi:MAG: MFS transporter [Opitutaceae bacterium]|jgi:UMF1 family MFS transporter|nr:MFS transporter [Opitutaceae bacterium]